MDGLFYSQISAARSGGGDRLMQPAGTLGDGSQREWIAIKLPMIEPPLLATPGFRPSTFSVFQLQTKNLFRGVDLTH